MHTYILHITGFILKHGTGCIRNHNRNVRLTYSFHTSCSDLAMNDKEKNKKAIDLIDELIGRYKIIEGVMMTSDQPDKVTVTKQTIYDL